MKTLWNMLKILKRNLIAMITILFIAMLVIYSKSNIIAAKNGLELWINHVFPSLFPFFIATEILSKTNFIETLGKLVEKPVMRLFRVPGEGAFALVMGMICGYPTGAKIVTDLKSQNKVTLEEAERLLAFTNNSGPLFILGTVGISLLNRPQIGYILLISHIIAGILVGIFFRNWKYKEDVFFRDTPKIGHRKETSEISVSDIGEILGMSIKNALATIMTIGGFIVLFSVILSILNSSGFFEMTGNFLDKIHISKELGNGIISGFIELTNGVKAVSLLPISHLTICILSFLIGFGGLSVLFQVYSIIAKENISIKPYFYGKLLQGMFSLILTGMLLALENYFIM